MTDLEPEVKADNNRKEIHAFYQVFFSFLFYFLNSKRKHSDSYSPNVTSECISQTPCTKEIRSMFYTLNSTNRKGEKHGDLSYGAYTRAVQKVDRIETIKIKRIYL